MSTISRKAVYPAVPNTGNILKVYWNIYVLKISLDGLDYINVN